MVPGVREGTTETAADEPISPCTTAGLHGASISTSAAVSSAARVIIHFILQLGFAQNGP